MLVSQNKLAELTGKDRKTIQKLLAERPAQSGPHRAMLYDSARALETIYCANGDGTFVSIAEAFRQLTLAKRTQIELQNAKFRDEFWPRAEIEFLIRARHGGRRANVKGQRGQVVDLSKCERPFSGFSRSVRPHAGGRR